LHETILKFHDMENRYKLFYNAVSRDCRARVKDVKKEISFMMENEDRGGILIRALRDGIIPERICHNDTKMNNILIDESDPQPFALSIWIRLCLEQAFLILGI